MLYTEYQVYSRFLKGVPGFARVYRWAHTKSWNYMVMELLGKDLGTLFKGRGNFFTFDTVCLIAVQVLSRLRNTIDSHETLNIQLCLYNLYSTSTIRWYFTLHLFKQPKECLKNSQAAVAPRHFGLHTQRSQAGKHPRRPRRRKGPGYWNDPTLLGRPGPGKGVLPCRPAHWYARQGISIPIWTRKNYCLIFMVVLRNCGHLGLGPHINNLRGRPNSLINFCLPCRHGMAKVCAKSVRYGALRLCQRARQVHHVAARRPRKPGLRPHLPGLQRKGFQRLNFNRTATKPAKG